MILLMLHRSESVFDKSSDKELLEMSYFSPWLVFLYSYCWPITTPRGFCDKRISSNVCITLALSSTVPIAQ